MPIFSCFPDDALSLSGGEMHGAIQMGGHKITGVGAPEEINDVVNKGYIDHLVGDIETLLAAI